MLRRPWGRAPPNKPPRLNPNYITAKFDDKTSTTTYEAYVTDDDIDRRATSSEDKEKHLASELKVVWYGPNCDAWKEEPGKFSANFIVKQFSWTHKDPPCTTGPVHGDVTVYMEVFDGKDTTQCAYVGAGYRQGQRVQGDQTGAAIRAIERPAPSVRAWSLPAPRRGPSCRRRPTR